MIVDDNPDTLSLVSEISARYDEVTIEGFDSPQSALEAWKKNPAAYEFILTDLVLPYRSGAAIHRRLRPLAPALTILVDAWNEILSDEEAVQKGFCRRVRKAFPFAALQRAVAPAALKYVGRLTGITSGLTLVPAF